MIKYVATVPGRLVDRQTGKVLVHINMVYARGFETGRFMFDSKWLAEDFISFFKEMKDEVGFNFYSFVKEMDGQWEVFTGEYAVRDAERKEGPCFQYSKQI